MHTMNAINSTIPSRRKKYKLKISFWVIFSINLWVVSYNPRTPKTRLSDSPFGCMPNLNTWSNSKHAEWASVTTCWLLMSYYSSMEDNLPSSNHKASTSWVISFRLQTAKEITRKLWLTGTICTKLNSFPIVSSMSPYTACLAAMLQSAT